MFKSLVRKIMLAMLTLTLLLSIFFTVFSSYQIRLSYLSQMEDDGKILITSIRREINRYNMDSIHEVQEIFLALKEESNENIQYISISDQEMNLIVSDQYMQQSLGNTDELAGASDDAIAAASENTSKNKIHLALAGIDVAGYEFQQPDTGLNIYNISAPIQFGEIDNATINIGLSLGDMYQKIRMNIIETIIIAIIAQVLVGVIGAFVSRSLTKPIRQMVEKIERFEQLDFNVQFDNAREDEIGALSKALSEAVLNIKSTFNTVKTTTDSLYEAAGQMAASSDELKNSSEDISLRSSDVAVKIERQELSLKDIVTALDRFENGFGIIVEENDKALEENQLITSNTKIGYTDLEALSTSIEQVTSAFDVVSVEVNQLKEDMNRINDFTEMINAIAAQTNLLALNAAIEAARAGEAGKGFAVVAGEIRQLADQVSNSSKNIDEIVLSVSERVQCVTDNASNVLMQMGQQTLVVDKTFVSFKEIHTNVEQMSKRLILTKEKIQDAYQEKDKIIVEINHLFEGTVQVLDVAEEIASSIGLQTENIREVSNVIVSLNNMADTVKHQIEKFKM